MTVICALHQNGETWIGADSRACGSHGQIIAGSIKKWIVSADAAIGSNGEAIATQILHRNRAVILHVPNPCQIADEFKSLIIPAFKESGDTESAKAWGVSSLIATHHGVYDVDSAFHVMEINRGTLWARGAGRDFAIGAGNATRGDNPMARVRKALEMACEFNAGCGGQLFIHRLGDPSQNLEEN